MTLKFLAYVFKLGRVLGCIPSSSQFVNDSLLKKVHSIFLAALITTVTAAAPKYKEYFTTYIHAKIVVNFLRDFFLWLSSIYFIIILGLGKRSSWRCLLSNFRKTEYLVNAVNHNTDFLYFVLANLVQLASSG